MSTNQSSPIGSDIAIVGMAGRFPGAATLKEFWANLRDAVESVRRFADAELIAAGEPPEVIADPDYVRARPVLPNVELFDAAFFGFSPQDAAIMDPQHRLFLEVGWEAIEDAGHDPATFPGNAAVFATCGMNTYMMYHLVTNQRIMQTVGEWLVRHSGNDMNFLATRLSYELGLKGPSMNVQTACSSALVAIHLSCQSLLNGECDMALAGGSVIALPQDRGYQYKPGEILSPDGHCRAFDARARGTLFGSGAGVVVLRRLADALADGDRIYAVVKGSAVNNDGSVKVGYLAPSVEGQSRAIVEALAISGVDPETISYIEAHGTGTLVGDPIEMTALTEAYRRHTDKKGFCAIGSLKTNIGHLGEAAGVAGFIKTVLSLQHRQIPASLHYESPNPQIDFAASPFFVNTTLHPWASATPRRAGITSLGAGGTNCHVIVEEAPAPEPPSTSRPAHLFLISAKTKTALDAAALNLATALEEQPSLSLADVAYTLQVGRKTFAHRRGIVGASRTETIGGLRSGKGFEGQDEPQPHPVVFMFPGQGSQYPRMGLGLYEHEPVFRKEIERCFEILDGRNLSELRALVFPTGAADAARLSRTIFTQPALFAIEYSLARLWIHWGLRPQSMIGHSIGEYVAACLSGVFSLPDALALVAARGALMDSLPSGAMLSVPQSATEVTALLNDTRLSVAAANAPGLSVISGPDDGIAAAESDLRRHGIECQRLRTSHAFHSAMMDPILEPFECVVKGIALNAPTIPFVSNVTGTWIRPDEATCPGYWVKQLRNTVRFSEGLATILSAPDQVLLEVGPGRTLSTLARQQRLKARTIVSSLRHPDENVSDVPFALGTLGRLWAAGLKPDWSGFYSAEKRQRVGLPTYPFERQRYWVEAGSPAPKSGTADQAELKKSADIGDWFYTPSWRRTPSAATAVDSSGDLVIFADEAGLGKDLAERTRRLIRPEADARKFSAFLLEFPTPGDPDVARLTPAARQEIGPDEVEIEVKTAALNFADALKVTGVQPDAPFGMECAGQVVRTGAHVTTLAPGDQVVAIGPGSFRSHVVRDARFVARKPPGLSWEEAVTIPAAFMTASYALEHVGRLAAGERILIHAASGGVGLAAVQIAQSHGAQILATAGSAEKRAYLKSLGIAHVFNSRTLDFASEIMACTNGAGVNMVLNSLTGEIIPRSLRLLAGNGRFLEIGKKEIYSTNQLKDLALPDGVEYHAIDLTRTLSEDPDLYGRLLHEVVDGSATQQWRPLSHHLYPVAQAADAFRLMIQARHIGKVVLSFDAKGPRTYLVEPGDRFARLAEDRFALNPARADDYAALLETLREQSSDIGQIVHLWSVSSPDEPERSLDNQLVRSFFSPLHLARALGHQELTDPIDLTIVSTQAHQVSGESVVQPAKATLLGPSRVIPREFPNVTCRNVDVQVTATGWQRERLVDQLVREIRRPGQEPVVAFRGGDRWVQTFEPSRIEQAERRTLRDGGCYLITGGLGDLGFEVARYLAETVRARLILIGRTSFPERREWTDWLRSHADDHRTADRIRQMREWENRGAQVFIAAADVADRDQMRRALNEGRARFGPLHGVFHAAGTLDDGLMQLKTDSSATSVLRPKVHGTLVLDELLAGESPDFVVLFSSVSGVLGLQGQVDYTAANAFLDAYAHSTDARGSTRAVSINWSAWQDVGMAANASRLRRPVARYGGTPARHPWLGRGRVGPAGEMTFANSFSRAGQWVIGEHVIKGGDALMPGTGFLELARAALAERAERRPIAIANVFFELPFVVRSDEIKELETTLRPDGSQYELTIQSPSGVHVSGSVQFVDTTPGTRVDVDGIASRCNIEQDTVKGFLKQDFMAFGRRWANVERVQLGAGEALVTLSLPAEFLSDLEQIRLHPALLDMATGGAQALIPEFDPASDFYVPFSYGRIGIYKNLPSRLFSHIRLREGGGHGSAFFDVSLVDGRGDLLVDIAGFCMKRVADRQLLIQQLTAPHQAPSPSAVAAASGGALADELLRSGIAPKEGIEALDRILSSQAAPQVLVSPVNLHGLMSRVSGTVDARPARPASNAAQGSADSRGPLQQTTTSSTDGDIEAGLERIWRDLLGVPSVKADDNFFDLGGHSLLAVRLITRIEKSFHKSLPLQTLLQAATFESLAAIIRGVAVEEAHPSADTSPNASSNGDWSPLVPIRQGGSRRPFFCVHGAGGNLLNFRDFSLRLGDEQPVYGLEARGVDGKLPPAESIEEMAELYLSAVRSVQQRGPYLLGGYSGGGVVALEMARRLAEAGEDTSEVVLMDTYHPAASARKVGWRVDLSSIAVEGVPFIWKWAVGSLTRHTVWAFRNRRLRHYLSRGQSVPHGLREWHLAVKFAEVLPKHVPQAYTGRVTLFRARDVGNMYTHLGDALGWDGILSKLEVVKVPGNHDSLVREPNVSVLAKRLDQVLERGSSS
jgi:acyl transferase domain-containing protein/NADPH:quinone reductase-like Zn-dependent oxidoreductase/thioesterase domain-containing protein/acyl carrier protein